MSIKRKLILAILLTGLGLAVLAVVNLVGGNIIARYNALDELSMQASIDMYMARTAEEEFLNTHDPELLGKVNDSVQAVERGLEDMVAIDPAMSGLVGEALQALATYRKHMLAAAKALQAQGLTHNDGLRGTLRDAAHDMEDMVAELRNSELELRLLSLRRYEKDFIMRHEFEDVDELQREMELFSSAMAASPDIPYNARKRLGEQLDMYGKAFESYAELQRGITSDKVAFLAQAARLVPMLEAIEERAEDLAESNTWLVDVVQYAVEIILFAGLLLFMSWTARSILRPLASLQGYSRSISGGELDTGMPDPFNGELEELRLDMAIMVNRLREKMDEADARSREADARAKDAEESKAEAQEKERAIGHMLDSMRSVANDAEEYANRLAGAAEKLAGQSEQISRGADVQRDRVHQTAAAVQQMNATVLEVASNAASAADNSQSVDEMARKGEDIVREVVDAALKVHGKTEVMKQSMNDLGGKVDNIGNIMNVITDIADQTNLLALNAAIEAARAGEAGRGFAVVADEVRKLAEKTMAATKEVEEAVVSIQQSTVDNIQEMSGASQAVERSTELAKDAGSALQEIVAVITENAGQITAIATAAEEQSATSEEINRSIEEINIIVSDTSESVRQSVDSIRELAELAVSLEGLIKRLNENKDSA